MNRKISSIFFLLMATLSLCGCQLAKEDGTGAQNDRLIGVLITREYLDLFDMERYLNDHLSSLSKGGVMDIEKNSPYEGRIYAALKPLPLTNDETGEKVETWEYVFESVNGIPFFFAKITPPDGDSFFGSHSDNAISNAHFSMGKDKTLEGTVYMASGHVTALYANPVFQTGDGDVYVTSGSGISGSGHDADGSFYSITLDEKYATTENGEKTEESFKVTVHFGVKYPPSRVRIIQMNGQNLPVSQKEYAPDDLPESISKHPDAVYMVFETYSMSPEVEVVNREIRQHGDSSFISYTVRDDGLCEEKHVRLLWE